MKPVFQGLFALICIAAVAALIISFSIDGIVKSSIQDTTSEMLGTTVAVDDVSISILDGTGSIKGFTIQNPEDFGDGDAMQIDEITLKLAPLTFLSDTLVIEELRIRRPELFMSQKLDGRNNLKMLADQLDYSDSSSDRYVVIDYLIIDKGRVVLRADVPGGESKEVAFSEIEMKDIGRKGNNTVKETVGKILEPIIKKALRQAVREGVIDQAKEEIKNLLEG